MAEHIFRLSATWNGGRNGDGQITADNLETAISAPKEMDGPGIGTNPEELLIGAASTCYLITLAAVLANRNVPLAEVTLESEGKVVVENNRPRFASIIHRPRVVLGMDATDEQKASIPALAERAEKACMISKAMHGNVEITVEPIVQTK